MCDTSSSISLYRCGYEWGSEEFYRPKCLAVASDGTVYVCDGLNNRIQCFSQEGNFIHAWGSKGDNCGQFSYPQGIAIGYHPAQDEAASLVVAMQSLPLLAAFPPGILHICVAYIGKERIYVSDTNNYRIQMFEGDGTHIHTLGARGTGEGQFLYPEHIAAGSQCKVYVCDYQNMMVNCVDAHRRKFVYGIRMDEVGDMRDIAIRTVDGKDDIYVLGMTDLHCYRCISDDEPPVKVFTWSENFIPFALNLAVDNRSQIHVSTTIRRSAIVTLQIEPLGCSILTEYSRIEKDFAPHHIAMGQNGLLYGIDCSMSRIFAVAFP